MDSATLRRGLGNRRISSRLDSFRDERDAAADRSQGEGREEQLRQRLAAPLFSPHAQRLMASW